MASSVYGSEANKMESSLHFSYLGVLLALALALALSAWFIGGRTRPKNPPPRPPSLPVLGHLHLIKKPVHRSLAGLAARYGPILSLQMGSRPVLVVSSPAAAEECFSTNDTVFANRPRLLSGKHLAYDYTTIAWASYGPLWRNLRRIAAVEILSSARLGSSAAVRREEVTSMVCRLARDAAAGVGGFGRVELKPRFYELTYNAMMRMIAGRRCYGEEVADVEEARRFREIVEETFSLSGASNLGDYLPALRMVRYRGVEGRLVRLQAKRDAFLQRLIDDHRNQDAGGGGGGGGGGGVGGEGSRKTIIDVLLALQQTEAEYYTDAIIKGVVVTLLTAGTDTSAITMEWAMSLLLNHPDELKKARDELDLQVGLDRLVDESDLPNLPYLNCIIKETLRLHPATPIIPAHESSSDCTVGGFDVPGGTMLLVNAWAIQRDPLLWAEPASFRPGRFVEAEGKKDGHRLIPFGSGRRACPGEGLAMRMVGLALAALIQCFEWDCGGEEVDLSERVAITMIKAKPLEAMCKPRRIVEGDFLA